MDSLRPALELFLLFKRAAGLRPKTIDEYRRYIERLIAVVPDDRSATPSDVASLMAWLLDTYSVYAARAHYRAIDIFFNWCEDSDELGNPVNPLGHGRRRKVQIPKLPKRKPRRAPQSDVLQLIDSISADDWLGLRDRAIVRFLFDTGVRAGECVGLNISDVDLANRHAIIYGGKGDKDRDVLFTSQCAAMLSTYLAHRPPSSQSCLFASAVNDDGEVKGRLSVRGLQMMLKRRCKQADLPPINPHSIRHLFGTRSLNNGMRLEAISQLMGHYSVDFTKSFYAEWANDGLQREYDEFNQ